MGKPLGRTITQGQDTPAPQIRSHPYLFLAIEGQRPLAGASRHSLADIDEVIIGRGDDRACERTVVAGKRRLAITVPDPRVSASHARAASQFGHWTVEDIGSKNGTSVNGQPITTAALADRDSIEIGHTVFIFRAALPAVAPLDQTFQDLRSKPPGLVTLVPAFHREVESLPRLARTDLSLLVLGESGTGKELMAQAVHALSERRGKFIAVNCGAIPATLVESALFGHTRGAFSGAIDDREGLVRAADRGTLFLDEIGDLPLASQAALLRVLQEKEVVPLGATQPVAVDLRVVAATHRDLQELVDKGQFRADLLARLSGATVRVPALRDRREELGSIIAALLGRSSTDELACLVISVEAALAMLSYRWPLNVRELEQALKAAIARSGGQRLDLEHLPPQLASARSRSAPPPAADAPLSVEDQKLRGELVELLRQHAGSISAVARALSKDRKQIKRWLKRLRLDPDDHRS
ncbi:MAG: sigma 54-interacting transcriptional regulator [Kofleriaceae bacterium]